ncbi:MAG: Uma2 family endonuclease [Chloroflexi bacterium]|nr:Uma2 family endonuclease [Chloroflexota bacterium]
MTYEEYLAWVDESIIAEWVDGEVIVHMPPKDRHQDIVLFLGSILRLFVDFFRVGKLLVAPFEMKLYAGGPSREPDILFISNENRRRLTEDRRARSPNERMRCWL